MITFLIRRLLFMVVTIVFISLISFVLMTQVFTACEHILNELRETQAHPVPFRDLTAVELSNYRGAEQWDEIQRRFK